MATDDLNTWLRAYQPRVGYRSESLGGGCINDTARIVFKDGGDGAEGVGKASGIDKIDRTGSASSLVVKQNSAAPPTMFAAEAAGLEAIAQTLAESNAALRTPAVMAVGETYLVLEDLGHGRPDSRYWEGLGRGLAGLHRRVQPQFGFSMDNYCGLTPQANPLTDDGHRFFAQQRLLALGRQCHERGLLPGADMTRLEHIADSLHKWIPTQPAVLVHGDLWSGNIHCCADGQPALIDPAAHWGWAEADLAMTQLFGGFAPAFYQAYATEAAAANPHWHPDWQERSALYNLYHLLNHLLLFGSSYLSQVQAVLRQYGAALRGGRH